MVQVEYDQKTDAMYIRLRKSKYDISEELSENVIMDLDKNGHIIGIEVLDASKNLGKDIVTKNPQHRKNSPTSLNTPPTTKKPNRPHPHLKTILRLKKPNKKSIT
jgi:uncharacterized protein YuzE